MATGGLGRGAKRRSPARCLARRSQQTGSSCQFLGSSAIRGIGEYSTGRRYAALPELDGSTSPSPSINNIQQAYHPPLVKTTSYKTGCAGPSCWCTRTSSVAALRASSMAPRPRPLMRASIALVFQRLYGWGEKRMSSRVVANAVESSFGVDVRHVFGGINIQMLLHPSGTNWSSFFGTRPRSTVELLLRNVVMLSRPLLTGEFPIFPNLGLKIQFPIHMETFPASLFSVRDENDMLVKRKISVGSRKSSADFYAVS